MQWLVKALKTNKGFIFFLFLMFAFRSSIADWNTVPTGSMNPTIVEGDRILVNKAAYDLRLPFTHLTLLKYADPARGDIIVFDSAVSEKRLVKRVIGLPGDSIAMRNNVLWLNGKKLGYENLAHSPLSNDREENLLGLKHAIRTKPQGSDLSSFSPVQIPAGFYLALGDNRDNSADSRVIGLVPRAEIIGRARNVVMSLDYEHYYLPRSERFFKSL
ncbi:signal peptidase I [uncultured Thiothrix sp.]|uniref:signal peptidase I n=1 Tax=uncultured Thiothrix sp. TaxID=223185 RepID=UPI00261F946C|nr:signal peptidase I [uncultured Thiothrix sp.]